MTFRDDVQNEIATLETALQRTRDEVAGLQKIPNNTKLVRAGNYPIEGISFTGFIPDEDAWIQYGYGGDVIINSDQDTLITLDADMSALQGGTVLSVEIASDGFTWTPGADDGIFYYAPAYVYRQHVQTQMIIKIPRGRYHITPVYKMIGNPAGAVVSLFLGAVSIGVRAL